MNFTKIYDGKPQPEDENYGQSGIQAFREIADKNGICIAREDSVRRNWISFKINRRFFISFAIFFTMQILSNDEEEKFEELMNNLNEDENASKFATLIQNFMIFQQFFSL